MAHNASSYNVSYTKPILALPPSPPRSPTTGDRSAAATLDSGSSTSTSPRHAFAQPVTPAYAVGQPTFSQLQQQQQQQESRQTSSSQPTSAVHEKFQAPHHYLSASTGQRRNSNTSPKLGQGQFSHQQQPHTQPLHNTAPPAQRSRSNHLNAIGESSLYKDHADATLSGFIGQLTDRLQAHLSSASTSSVLPFNSNNNNDEAGGGGLKKLIPTASMLRYGCLCVLWYSSSAVSNNTGKDILARFRYPVTLTLIQFGIVSFYCILFCAARQHLSYGAGGAGAHARRLSHVLTHPYMPGTTWWKELLAACGVKRASKTALHGTLVMSFFQISGHVFSSMATARMPVSTVHTIKALSPLFTVFSYALLFRVKYSTSTYISLIPLTLGVMLACSLDLRANLAGSVFAFGSTIIFVSQNIFSKKLLPKESQEEASGPHTGLSRAASQQQNAKLDKINLLLYSSGMAFLLMIPMWAYSDLAALLAPKPTPPNPVSTTALCVLFLINGSVHFFQCFLAFTILARSSPVAYSIASLIKRVAVICLAIVWFGQKIGFVQAFGMCMTFAGLYMYNRAKSDIDRGERKRMQAERRSHLVLPTTASDARLMDLGSLSRTQSPDISPSSTPMPQDMRTASPAPQGLGIAGIPPQRSIYQPVFNGLNSPSSLSPSSRLTPPVHGWRDASGQMHGFPNKSPPPTGPSLSPAAGTSHQMQPIDMSYAQSKHRHHPSLDVAAHRQ